jgi:hypothetical protein
MLSGSAGGVVDSNVSSLVVFKVFISLANERKRWCKVVTLLHPTSGC